MTDSLAQCVRTRAGTGVSGVAVDSLLRDGADIDACSDHCTALGWACEQGDAALVSHLLERGAAVEKGRTGGLFSGQSPLSIAAGFGHVDVVRALLVAGADANSVDSARCTPLMYATFRMRDGDGAAVADVLLRAGADVSCVNRYERTALHHAALHDEAGDGVRLLLVHGASVYARDWCGVRPLHYAAGYASAACARWLLAAASPIELHVDAYDWLLPGAARTVAARGRLVESLGAEMRALARDRLDLVRPRATEICVALQTLELPALLTLMIIEQACELAHLASMHQIWSLVTTVKHFDPTTSAPVAMPRFLASVWRLFGFGRWT